MSLSAQKPVCLLFGANGQVGFELAKVLAEDYQLVALDRSQCDLSNEQQICNAIQNHKPDIIINAAAYTAVDKAESEQDLAFAINATAVGIIAREAKKIHASVLHYSTDYVFGASLPASLLKKGGEQQNLLPTFLKGGLRGIRESGNPNEASLPTSLLKKGGEQQNLLPPFLTETDIPNPINVYGMSKLLGEQLLIEHLGENYPAWILRTSWVYGVHGNNFLKTMLKLGSSKETLSVVSDQIGAPTSARLIADITARLLQIQPEPGIYHLCAAGQTSWYSYAQLIFTVANQKGLPLLIKEHGLSAITTAEYPTPAKRPANSVLNCDKLEQALAIALPDWRMDVEQTIGLIAENQAT